MAPRGRAAPLNSSDKLLKFFPVRFRRHELKGLTVTMSRAAQDLPAEMRRDIVLFRRLARRSTRTQLNHPACALASRRPTLLPVLVH